LGKIYSDLDAANRRIVAEGRDQVKAIHPLITQFLSVSPVAFGLAVGGNLHDEDANSGKQEERYPATVRE
jgi:hypothetical protein